MSSAALFQQTTMMRLPHLLKMLGTGELCVPAFQRGVVWSHEDRLRLFDSIFRKFPIGSLLVWRTTSADVKASSRLGPVLLKREESSVPPGPRQFIVDGVQRLVTLYSALGPGLHEGDFNWDTPDGTAPPAWRIFFDVSGSERFCTGQEYNERRIREWLPLDILFNPSRMFAHLNRLQQGGSPAAYLNRAHALADRFKDYTVPLISTVAETHAEVAEMFRRINATGVRLSRADMLRTVTWDSEVDLDARIEALEQGELGTYLSTNLDKDLYVQVLKAVAGLSLHALLEEVGHMLSDEPDILDDVDRCLVEVAKLLARMGVPWLELVPYPTQIALLAGWGPEIGLQVDSDADAFSARIRDWFWLTTVTEYFSNISKRQLSAAKNHLDTLMTRGGDPRPPNLADTLSPLEKVDYRSGQTRAFALLLAEQHPRDTGFVPVDGYRALAQHGADALSRLLSTQELPESRHELIHGPGNYFLLPPLQARDLRTFLLNTKKIPKSFLDSHAIPRQAMQALLDGEYVSFLELRQACIHDMEQARAREIGLTYLRR